MKYLSNYTGEVLVAWDLYFYGLSRNDARQLRVYLYNCKLYKLAAK